MRPAQNFGIRNPARLRITVDVLGIFRFVTVVWGNQRIEQICRQMEDEFNELYKLSIPLKVLALEQAGNSQDILDVTAPVISCLKDKDMVYVRVSREFVNKLRKTPWEALGTSKERYNMWTCLLSDFFGAARYDTLQSCLLRAGGTGFKITSSEQDFGLGGAEESALELEEDEISGVTNYGRKYVNVDASLEKASAIVAYISPETLGSWSHISFIR